MGFRRSKFTFVGTYGLPGPHSLRLIHQPDDRGEASGERGFVCRVGGGRPGGEQQHDCGPGDQLPGEPRDHVTSSLDLKSPRTAERIWTSAGAPSGSAGFDQAAATWPPKSSADAYRYTE